MRLKKLFVANLSYQADENSVKELFKSIECPLRQATIVRDDYGDSKGYAFVELDEEYVDEAIHILHGNLFMGRQLAVQLAKRQDRQARVAVGGKR